MLGAAARLRDRVVDVAPASIAVPRGSATMQPFCAPLVAQQPRQPARVDVGDADRALALAGTAASVCAAAEVRRAAAAGP